MNNTEQDVQNTIRLAAAKRGWRLWRNNNGAGYMSTGSYVRFGLGNDSEKINARIKSSDLIGIRPVTITPDMVGQTLGQFVSIEVKRPGWTAPTNDRERAQATWLQLIRELGGLALFLASDEDLPK